MLYEHLDPTPRENPVRSRRSPGVRRCAASVALVSAVLSGCSAGSNRERTFEPARIYEPVGRSVRWNASSAERFGISAQDFAAGPATGALHWTTPETWVELPPAPFREANFRVAGEERAECYLSTLSGEGGGLSANVNRWRAQLSLEPLSPEEVAALPRQAWLGGEAVFMDVSGTWSGTSGGEAAQGWRLIGLLLVDPARSRFLKMTGPAQLVDGELEHFRALAASFHEVSGGSARAAE